MSAATSHICIMSDSCLCAITEDGHQIRGDEADERLYDPDDACQLYAGTQWGKGIRSFSWFHWQHKYWRRSFQAGVWFIAGNDFVAGNKVVDQFPEDHEFISAMDAIAANIDLWCGRRGGVVLYGTFSFFRQAYSEITDEDGRLFMSHMSRLRTEFIKRGVPVLWLKDSDLRHIPLGWDNVHVLDSVSSRESQRELIHSAVARLLNFNEEAEQVVECGAEEACSMVL